MDVNAVMKQNFVYRMVFKDILLIFYRTFTVILFYETFFTQRHLLFLHNLCVYSLYHARLSYVIKGFTYLLKCCLQSMYMVSMTTCQKLSACIIFSVYIHPFRQCKSVTVHAYLYTKNESRSGIISILTTTLSGD